MEINSSRLLTIIVIRKQTIKSSWRILCLSLSLCDEIHSYIIKQINIIYINCNVYNDISTIVIKDKTVRKALLRVHIIITPVIINIITHIYIIICQDIH